MARLAVLLLGALALGGCGDSASTPAPDDPPAPAPKPNGFQFEPTLNAHRPRGSELVLVAEVGNPATGNLSLVVAQHDGMTLSLATWRFASTGADETLVPVGPPKPLLGLRSGEPTDAEALDALVRTRAAGHTLGGRPQGVSASDAAAALSTLHAHAVLALDSGASARARTEALASFTRGLDDALLFSRTGLSRSLTALATSVEPSSPEGSQRRASVRWGDVTVSMLRKADGWSVDALNTP